MYPQNTNDSIRRPGHGRRPRLQALSRHMLAQPRHGVKYTPDGEEHWHGAIPEHFMTHLSITEGAPHWGAHVTDAEYQTPQRVEPEPDRMGRS